MKNRIHPTAQISPDAQFGEGNIIKEGVIIRGNVVIGDNNVFEPYVIVGKVGECRGETEPKGKVMIGDNNHFHERVSIHSPVRTPVTVVKDDCYVMHNCHIAHDCIVNSGVTMAPMCILGGVVEVGYRANLGMSTVVKPRKKIGKLCMIGFSAAVTKDVPNFETWVGNPARFRGYNKVGMERAGMSKEQISKVCADS